MYVAGNETQNPRFVIPKTIVISIGISALIYLGLTLVITLMVPYYAIDLHEPLSMAFIEVGWNGVENVIRPGVICGILSRSVHVAFGGTNPVSRTSHYFVAKINQCLSAQADINNF